MPSLSVIIVNFNGARLLQDCLDALEAQVRAADEVVVVDNGSTDATVQMLRDSYPWVSVIEAGANLGFAGGNNAGVRASSGEIVVLLNNDTIPSPGFLDHIDRAFEQGSELSAVAGVMLFSTCVETVATTGIEVFDNGLALDRNVGMDWRGLPSSQEVFGPSGGAAAFRREALDDVELFPEPYFLYLEDVDLAWRLRLRRHETTTIRDAWVLHVYSASSVEGSPLKDYFLARNRSWTLIRCWPLEFWKQNWFRTLTYESRAIAYALVNRRWSSIQGRWDGWRAFRRLSRSRRRIQNRTTSSPEELLYWMRSAPSVRELLQLRSAITMLTDSRTKTQECDAES